MDYHPNDLEEAAAAQAEELEAAAAAAAGASEDDVNDDDDFSEEDGDEEEEDPDDEDDDDDGDTYEDYSDGVDEAALLAGVAAPPGRRRVGAAGPGQHATATPAEAAPTNPLFPSGDAAAARVAAIEALPGGRRGSGAPTDAPYLAYAAGRRRRDDGGAGPGPSTAAAAMAAAATCPPPTKRPRRSAAAALHAAPADVFGVTADDIFGADMLGSGSAAPGARRRAKIRERLRVGRRARGVRAKLPPPAARARMSDANMAIVAGDYAQATALLKEAVRLAPNWPEPYESLGSAALQAGDSVRAMNFFFIAAHLHKGRPAGKVRAAKKAAAARASARRRKEREAGIGGDDEDDESEEEEEEESEEESEEDGRRRRRQRQQAGSSSSDGGREDDDDDDPYTAAWRRLAKMSADHGMLRQAIYCLTKLVARRRGDEDAAWDRAVMYAQVGEHRAALRGFTRLARSRPGDGDIVKWVARMHHALRDPGAAAAALEGLLAAHPASVDLTHINMLAELRLAGGDAAGVAALVARARRMVAEERGSDEEGGGSGEDAEPALPADLEIKAAAADAALGDAAAARDRLVRCVLGGEVGAAPDLLEAAGGLLMQVGAHEDGVAAFQRALVSSGGGEAGQAPPPAALWERLASAARAAGGPGGEAAALRGLLAEEGAPPDTHAEAALRLAELAVRTGDLTAARRLLGREEEGGDGDGSVGGGGLEQDDATLAAAAAALAGPAGGAGDRPGRAADLLLDLGEADAFLAAVAPAAVAALDRAEAAAALRSRLAPDVRKALARRARGGGGGPGGPAAGAPTNAVAALAPPAEANAAAAAAAAQAATEVGEAAAVFKGFAVRDRRRAHIRTADEAAAVLDAAVEGGEAAAAAAATGADPAEEEEEQDADAGAALVPAAATKGVAAAPLDADGFRAAARVARALLTKAASGGGARAAADQAAALVSRLAAFVHKPRGRAAAAASAARGPDGGARWGPAATDALALLQADAALLSGAVPDPARAIGLLRAVCARRRDDNAAWNAYARAATAAGAARGGTRWLGAVCEGMKGDESEEDEDDEDEEDDARRTPLPPLVLLGAARTCGGDPARGAADLAAARAAAPGEPLPALGLAVSLAALAAAGGGGGSSSTSPSPHRHRAAAAALAHLADYARLRGHPSEAAYNTGRLLHGLGLPSHAAAWYGRALAGGHPLVPPGAHRGASIGREAAHNLALLVRGGGDSRAGDALARRVLRKYATY